jgi:hypothetical protein
LISRNETIVEVIPEEIDMRIFLISCAAAALLALGWSAVLHFMQEPVAVAYSTPSVRL